MATDFYSSFVLLPNERGFVWRKNQKKSRNREKGTDLNHLSKSEGKEVRVAIMPYLQNLSITTTLFSFRAHLHMAKNLPTNSRRILDEYSTKNFSSPVKNFSSSSIRRQRIFNFNFNFLRNHVHKPKNN